MYHKKTPTDLSAIKFLRGVMQRSLGSQCCHMFRSGAVQKNLEKKHKNTIPLVVCWVFFSFSVIIMTRSISIIVFIVMSYRFQVDIVPQSLLRFNWTIHLVILLRANAASLVI